MLNEKINELDVEKIDKMDDKVFEAIVQMGKIMDVEVNPSNFTNEFLMEIRNQILENMEECFEIKEK